MNIIIPINGRNERMGQLFKTPKHLLLYKGETAILLTLRYLVTKFPGAIITILTNDEYIKGLGPYSRLANVVNVGPTDSQVETLLQDTKKMTGEVMFVDCDIIPIRIKKPQENTVFVFENTRQDKQYSNYAVNEFNRIVSCNEKEKVCKYAGAGIYFFEEIERFNFFAPGRKNVSEVIKELISRGSIFRAEPDNEIFRFGTLKDIIT